MKNKINTIEIDKLYSSENIDFNTIIYEGFEGTTVTVKGNRIAGTIFVQTGENVNGNTPVTIEFNDTNIPTVNFDTDKLLIFIMPHNCPHWKRVDANSVTAISFELYSPDEWQPNEYYQFKYHIVANSY